MNIYLYLSATPEAIIASMLPPREFGNYLAVGAEKRAHGQAIFFELDMEKMNHLLPMDYINSRCVPQQDGQPKRSVYLSIYRALEFTPLDALKDLYLATDDGRVLELGPQLYTEIENEISLHLFQELLPVTPRVVSSLNPREFLQYMTEQVEQIQLPKLFFVELELGELATDPVNGSVENLPYPNVQHLKDCLTGLKYEPQKIKKTVIRFFHGDLLYRLCKNGFFIGSKGNLLYYPLPSMQELEKKHYAWWRSAISTSLK